MRRHSTGLRARRCLFIAAAVLFGLAELWALLRARQRHARDADHLLHA